MPNPNRSLVPDEYFALTIYSLSILRRIIIRKDGQLACPKGIPNANDSFLRHNKLGRIPFPWLVLLRILKCLHTNFFCEMC